MNEDLESNFTPVRQMKKPLLRYEADHSINSDHDIIEDYDRNKKYQADDLETNLDLIVCYKPPKIDTILIERKHAVNSL